MKKESITDGIDFRHVSQLNRIQIASVNICYSQFNPADKYFINCGSLSNTSIGNRVFISDNLASSFLSTPQNVLVDTSADSAPSSEYSELDFKSDGAQLKEYSVNVTSGDLEITFTPSGSSFAFLNALEVVSVPDSLITDDATSVTPPTNFNGLLNKALETVARVNMGGPTIRPSNDSLWRFWATDRSFSITPNLESNASKLTAVKYLSGGATLDNAPVSHLIRLHFCDIVSTSANTLYFNVYIGDSNVLPDLHLPLATAYYADFVTQSLNNSQIRISIGPSTIEDVYPDAILNGVEIMKISSSNGSLSGGNIANTPNSKSGSKKSSRGTFSRCRFVMCL
ncbi:hypothetical protein L2E82_01071 [Cichorium intybus]|uniref:Uncharacterized protein n=1 Tax=Cichorium intybus TaxID=13427 RepID=A0ACB9GXS5_CICIN|nr:hypothetical protein L2E82_01071 [Cichorium intybus]